MNNFGLYSRYYDLVYKDKEYAAEAGYVLHIIREYFPFCSSLLELGCGTGNHASHFCVKGLSVDGIEKSANMVEEGLKKNIKGFRPCEADITDFSMGRTYDTVISLFHVISYLVHNSSLVSCFKAVHKHLNPGGLFLFDAWYSPAVYLQLPQTRIKRITDADYTITRMAEPLMHTESNVVEVNYEIIIRQPAIGQTEVFNETHTMRHFSIPEIELLAGLTGFRLIKAEEFLTGAAPSRGTWGVCFLLQKDENG